MFEKKFKHKNSNKIVLIFVGKIKFKQNGLFKGTAKPGEYINSCICRPDRLQSVVTFYRRAEKENPAAGILQQEMRRRVFSCSCECNAQHLDEDKIRGRKIGFEIKAKRQ